MRLSGRLARGVRFASRGRERRRVLPCASTQAACSPDYDLEAYRVARRPRTTEERFARALLDQLDKETDPEQTALLESALYYGLDAFRLRESGSGLRGAWASEGARMKLWRLKVDGFGALKGEFAFDPTRLTLLVDDNERGKSTLLAGGHGGALRARERPDAAIACSRRSSAGGRGTAAPTASGARGRRARTSATRSRRDFDARHGGGARNARGQEVTAGVPRGQGPTTRSAAQR